MLTLARILMISTLFSSLLFGSHGKENPDINTTQSIIEGLKPTGNKPTSLESEANLNSNNENRNTSNPNTSHSPLLDLLNKVHGMTDFSGNLSTENSSGSPRPTSTLTTTPPLIHSFVSKLPWNTSIVNNNPLLVSPHPNATPAVSSEKFTSSLASNTMKTPDNGSSTAGILPSETTTKSVTPLITEQTGWHTTNGDSFTGFTPYQEKTTVQPTLKFTNNSKLFPNTSDPQKVLRLDNAPEPYDVSFGNSSYYNPAGNDSSMPEGRENARDSIPMDDIPPLRTSV
ncbi:PREDICTED: mucin-15 [Propithecus coquereli]|uniref:mucin-15 n=1 Tax=Propithecus coquereli TaxID=379532 RepID=UPI00063F6A80|nr:PREDICTED: mucin-15 [Propithecus coquereli]